ncbi:EMAL1-like protein, partial [Mya arenaria]
LNTDLVCDIGFNPKYPDSLVTVGKEHTCWWKVYPDSATIQNSASPEYDQFLRAKFTICLDFNEGGDLVTVMYYKSYILSGGRDGIIHCWVCNKNMDSAAFVKLPETEGGVRMLCVGQKELMIGTTMNSLLVVPNIDNEPPLRGSFIEHTPLTQSHYDDVRGITRVTNSSTDIITAGLDGLICGYSTSGKISKSKVQFK